MVVVTLAKPTKPSGASDLPVFKNATEISRAGSAQHKILIKPK
jgi:hypothetical protein